MYGFFVRWDEKKVPVSGGSTVPYVNGLCLANCGFQFIVSQLMFYSQNLHTALVTICNLYLGVCTFCLHFFEYFSGAKALSIIRAF